MSSPSFDQDRELAEFFTDVESLREAFNNAVAAPTLAKRLFVIHGVGGVGKSSLLRMFRLHCRSVNVPVALASGDEAKSALDVLVRWVDDLKVEHVAFPASGKTYEHYRALQAKVEVETGKIAGQAVKGAAKTAIETAASTIPGIGLLLGKLGGTSVEALADILLSRGFKKPDIDLLLDPTKKLTDDFLADLARVTDKRRIVLMLDTFEQMIALEDWAREIAQRLPVNVLLVIAGRALPNWGRAWDSWQKNAQVEELKPMTEDVMRQLIQRYYATMRGGEPEPAQVEAIIRFARGLPMAVTGAVQLWVKYDVEDFEAVKPEVVANLVDRLTEGVSSTLVPALEAAATVRWFNQPILRAVMKQDDVRDAYNELRRFPFVRVRVEGLALHDAVREIMDENLRAQDSQQYHALHERAATYFEKRLAELVGEEAERLSLERLYHRVCVDEGSGMELFQEMAEELARYGLVRRLRILLHEVDSYTLIKETNRLWCTYYNANAAHLEGIDSIDDILEQIVSNQSAETKLKGYALSDLGAIKKRSKWIFKPHGLQTLEYVVQSSNQLIPEHDPRRLLNIINLAGGYHRLDQFDISRQYYTQALTIANEWGDRYMAASIYVHLADSYTREGNWQSVLTCLENGLQYLPESVRHSKVHADLENAFGFSDIWAGRYFEAEKKNRKLLDYRKDLGEIELLGPLTDLGFALGIQGRYNESDRVFTLAAENSKSTGQEDIPVSLSFWKDILLVWQGKWNLAKEKLHPGENIQWLCEGAYWLGRVYELTQDYANAEKVYQENVEKRPSRKYFLSASLTGLVRVKHMKGDYVAISPLLAEAGQLAQQYEYNDHLASLRLTEGHIAWDGKAPTWDNGFEAALHFHQHALIYALRYNRFLLDEVLSGRLQGTPLRPIIPSCLERGEEGRQMLTALREWWQTGINDIGTPRSNTISPIPEGIPLLEAEKIARDREPGDGLPQKSVIEQIEAANFSAVRRVPPGIVAPPGLAELQIGSASTDPAPARPLPD
ncbi:hypothetical protein ANRL4_01885 [Anaerolineae bacterium]|nr:hypothetical protein ANRL4_01885 [Anaerolineae bacterium]